MLKSIDKFLEEKLCEKSQYKMYFEEDSLWLAYGQGSGSTTYMPRGLKAISNKKSDSSYDFNIDKIIEVTNELKPIKTSKTKSMSLYEVPVYDRISSSSYSNLDTIYDIWGGNVKPTKKYYMTINKSGVIVAEFFKTKNEALNWINSII